MLLHTRLSLFLIAMMCLSGLLSGQNNWPPPPPSDVNWSGFTASASGPLPDDGPSVSAMAANGDVYIAGVVGSGVKVFHWDGANWNPLGERLYLTGAPGALIEDIAVGANGDIYVCGNFDRADNGGGAIEVTPYVARWDAAGQAWAPVGGGTDTRTSDISVDVNNNRVYVVGPAAGINPDGSQVPLNGVGCWDIGQNSWQPMGQGVSSQAMSILADGAGNVYVGGTFTEVFAPNGTAIAVNGIARWDGQNWHALGQGLTASMQPYPTELAFDSNGLLYVGGRFATAVNTDGSQVAGPLVSWDGSVWQSLGHPASFNMLGMAVDGHNNVYSLNLDPNFNPPAILKYDGVFWTTIGEFTGEGIATLSANPDRPGVWLFAGGLFWGMTDPGNGQSYAVSNNALWNGLAWSPIVGTAGFNGTVYALGLRSAEGALFVGGVFSAVGAVAANNIARFRETRWSSLGGGVNGPVRAISRNPFSPLKVIGGEFTEAINADGSPVNALNIALWTETDQWLPLGQGVDGPVYAILDNTYRFQGNFRGDIIVGGNFSNAYNPDGTPVPVTSLARWRWQTDSWEPIVNGLTGANVEVRTLTAEAEGPPGLSANVYVGGKFDGGINDDNTVVNSANVIKLYQNDFPFHWEALGQGVDEIVYALALRIQPGYEPLVWAGGGFQTSTNANGSVLNTPFLSLWDENSTRWFALGGGTNGPVYAIEVMATSYYDGAIIGGDFTLGYYQNGNARSLNHIALFNLSPPRFGTLTQWNERGMFALDGPPRAIMAVFPCPARAGEIFHAGGEFTTAGGFPAPGLARWNYTWRTGVNRMFNISASNSGGNGYRLLGSSPVCNYINSRQNTLTDVVLFDSLAYGESTVIDSLQMFQTLDLTLYDVDNPVAPLAVFDSVVIGIATPMTMLLTGVDDTTLYAPNPEGLSTALGFQYYELPVDSAQTGQARVMFINAVTDAPVLDISVQGGAALVQHLSYGEGSAGINLSPALYTFDVAQSATGQLINSFSVDLSAYADEAVAVIAGGFLDPGANQNGPPLSLEAYDTGQPVVGIDDDVSPASLIRSFRLEQNYPNPFNPGTNIAFTVSHALRITLRIYDILGRLVKTLIDGPIAAGSHSVQWNGRNDAGQPVASGVYLYRLQAVTRSGKGFVQTRKMVLLR